MSHGIEHGATGFSSYRAIIGVDSLIYPLAYELVAKIDATLSTSALPFTLSPVPHNSSVTVAIWRDVDGNELQHLDQIVRAILENRLQN